MRSASLNGPLHNEILQLTELLVFLDRQLSRFVRIPYEPNPVISDSTSGYTLTRTGLSQTNAVRPTSMFRMPGATNLSGTAVTASNPQACGLRTDTFDGGFRGVHEVVNVRVATFDTSGWTVAVAWRLNKNDAFTTTSAVAFDDRGNARVKVSGIEFQLVLSAADRTAADLERVEIEMRMGGKKKFRQLI